jgi:NodT family efflux transporter outer membrane factor (OMF) lipoprotein
MMRRAPLPASLPVALAALLAGCTVGPNYSGPPVAAPGTLAPAFVRTGDAPVMPRPPAARWWDALGDATLSAIETRALAANPDLAAAEARIRQARAGLREQKADLLPNGSASALYAHARIPGLDLDQLSTGSGQTAQGQGGGDSASSIDLYNLGFDASWEVDLFGGQRRAVEAARATVGGAQADLADAQVSLTAEVAQAYINLRDRQRRIALNERSTAMQEQMLALTRQRYDRGTASREDVAGLTQQLDTTRANDTPLRAERDAYLDELATLSGESPGALDPMLAIPGPVPLPPAQVAIGDPAALLQRRPDIRSAERTLAADTAKIGQADAARFPKVSFMGIIGIGGASPRDLTHLDDFTALLAPQISWNFLDFGRNAARIHQAEAVRDEAEAKYRSAVLAALRDAEDSLSRFRYRRATVASLARAAASADEAVALAQQRYAGGTITLIALLDSQRQQIDADETLSVAKAALTGDFVAIQKALGLGWGPIPTMQPVVAP